DQPALQLGRRAELAERERLQPRGAVAQRAGRLHDLARLADDAARLFALQHLDDVLGDAAEVGRELVPANAPRAADQLGEHPRHAKPPAQNGMSPPPALSGGGPAVRAGADLGSSPRAASKSVAERALRGGSGRAPDSAGRAGPVLSWRISS